MIPRTVFAAIERSIRSKPVTLIIGSRQVGKTTVCSKLVRELGFGYVSLANIEERVSAREDPAMFLRTHPAPLIIDEVQYAPALFDYIESIIDRIKFEEGHNEGMYVLTSSQVFNLMQGVTQSMAGRVGIIRMLPLSLNEIRGRDEPPFQVDFEPNILRSCTSTMDVQDVYRTIVRGCYPELYAKSDIVTSEFYSDYVTTYIERDVSQVLRVTDQGMFLRFMRVMASLTGQELVYDTVAKAIGADMKTVKSWTSVLESCGIIHLLQPYSGSTVRSMSKRPKMYFWDTGLACHLAKVTDVGTLSSGYLLGHMVETLIVNEVMKSYSNNRVEAGFNYYRDTGGNEVDLVISKDGVNTLIECKSGMTYDRGDVKSFSKLANVGPSCIICLTEKAYPISDGVYVLPLTSI